MQVNPIRPRLYVGIVGQHGSGKTGLMDRVEELLLAPLTRGRNTPVPGFPVIRQSFAQPIRRGLGMISGTPLDTKKRSPLERPSLQFIGEKARSRDSNAWLHLYLQEVDNELKEREEALVKDFRANGGGHDFTPSPRRTIVLTDDVYHFNEAMAMDLLILVKYPGVQPEPSVDAYDTFGQPYVAVSKRHTHALLTCPEELLAKYTLVIEAASPEELNVLSNAEFIAEHITRLSLLDDPNQASPRIHHLNDLLKEPA